MVKRYENSMHVIYGVEACIPLKFSFQSLDICDSSRKFFLVIPHDSINVITYYEDIEG
jgi:hypothetical protein